MQLLHPTILVWTNFPLKLARTMLVARGVPTLWMQAYVCDLLVLAAKNALRPSSPQVDPTRCLMFDLLRLRLLRNTRCLLQSLSLVTLVLAVVVMTSTLVPLLVTVVWIVLAQVPFAVVSPLLMP